jgi:hypothetical protein
MRKFSGIELRFILTGEVIGDGPSLSSRPLSRMVSLAYRDVVLNDC